VGFGVYARSHFETVVNAGADAVVVGSRIVAVIRDAGNDIPKIASDIQKYCRELTLKDPIPAIGKTSTPDNARNGTTSPALPMPPSEKSDAVPPAVSIDAQRVAPNVVLPARFGQFGGQYVPEALVDCLLELEEAHRTALADSEFWKEFEGYYEYINRPSNLYEAKRLTEHAGGARIWLKREDLWVTLSCLISTH
jgi:tryptophan synthase